MDFRKTLFFILLITVVALGEGIGDPIALLSSRIAALDAQMNQIHSTRSSTPFEWDMRTERDFHNMLTLPSAYVPNKISFRSCIDHDHETTLASIEGAGCIRLFWVVTGMGAAPQRPAGCVFTKDSLLMTLRIYFDGSPAPQVEAPLGALFGFHHDLEDQWAGPRDWNTPHGQDDYGADNLLFSVSENGALSLLVPMPFRNGCRITLQDDSPDKTIKMRVWSQISYHQYPDHWSENFPEPLRFHAYYRRENRSSYTMPHQPRVYHVGHALGRGYLLGFSLGVTIKDTHDNWFHNGADLIILDHMRNPRVLKGTGGEDFFGTSCWFFGRHNFREWGFMYGSNNDRFSAYRFFVETFRIPFRHSFSFEYGMNSDIAASTIYYFQDHRTFKGLPQRIIPGPQRLSEFPDQSLTTPLPPGPVPIWTISNRLSLDQWESPPAFAGFFDAIPSLGFLSLGAHFFEYTTNEGYPVNTFVMGEGLVAFKDYPIQIWLKITYDDPIEVHWDGSSIFLATSPEYGHQTKSVLLKATRQTHSIRFKAQNLENINSRAFVIGFQITTMDNIDLFLPETSLHDPLDSIKSQGTSASMDGGCE